MIWLFDRGGEQITYEICRDDESGDFLVVMTSASMEQMQRLHEDGWKIG